ncbi:MAG: thioredoxin domain-containing protein [Fuerstiella sp.]|nr:thioredoxin domain-containing protein [Fuerstiella sp.]
MKKLQIATRFTCTICIMGLMAGIGIETVADESPKAHNRLAQENSPYLLLHAHNPVDWYPWGPEALQKAETEDKLIFLSVGYSSCYWCHVMERKVFSSEKIANYLNEHFVCIKVDREERPDIDEIYMTSLLVYQQLSGKRGGGGWPLSLFLTPSGDPVAGATYLPPEDQPNGRTGFLTAATRMLAAWTKQRENVERTSQLISREVRRLSLPAASSESSIDSSVVQTAVTAVESLYDSEWGGVDLRDGNVQGPRFPNVPRLLLLMSVIEEPGTQEGSTAEPTARRLNIVRHSFSQMAYGGIRDHLAGGFHRYSTDRRWRIPHFEKMLYDQAQLLEGYVVASRVTGDPFFKEVAAEIADFVRNEFTTPEGAFCSALDAETNAVEGEYYVWKEFEIDQLLSASDATLFKTAYGVGDSNSFEHGHVLHLPATLDELSQTLKIPVGQLKSRLSSIRQSLLNVRNKRERPLLDDKILTAWNAMMIRSLAISGHQLGRPSDIDAAERAARFLLLNLRAKDGSLLRSFRNGEAKHAAYLDDYAYLVSALIALHETTGNEAWLQSARELNQRQLDLFYDDAKHIFYFTAHDQQRLIARTSSPFDSVFPSGNSVAIRNLMHLSDGSAEVAERAYQTLLRFVPVIEKSPSSSSGLALAAHEWLIAAEKRAAATIDESLKERLPFVKQNQDGRSLFVNALSDDETLVKSVTVFRPVLTPEPVTKSKAPKRVTAKVYPLYNKLPRGEVCPVAIELNVQKGWHINASKPSPDFLIPTKITLRANPKVKVRITRIKYPKHKLHRMKEEPEPYHVYDGKVMIYCLLETDAREQSDKTTLQFHIRYQACNDRQCEKPVTEVMTGTLSLADPGDDIKTIHRNRFPQTNKDQLSPDEKK